MTAALGCPACQRSELFRKVSERLEPVMKSGRRFGMLRKVCAVAVASVLAAGCLTACGSSKNTGPLTLDQIKENGKLTVATEAAYEPFE